MVPKYSSSKQNESTPASSTQNVANSGATSKFFRRIGGTVALIIVAGVLTIASPQKTFAQQQDTMSFNCDFASDTLLIKFKDGQIRKVSLSRVTGKDSLSISDMITEPIPGSLKGFGEGYYLVFSDVVLGIFPEKSGSKGCFIGRACAPEGETFFLSPKARHTFSEGFIILSENSITGFLNGKKVEKKLSDRFKGFTGFLSPAISDFPDSRQYTGGDYEAVSIGDMGNQSMDGGDIAVWNKDGVQMKKVPQQESQ